MDAKLVTIWALVLMIFVVLGVTIRHARRAERDIAPPPRHARRARAERLRADDL